MTEEDRDAAEDSEEGGSKVSPVAPFEFDVCAVHAAASIAKMPSDTDVLYFIIVRSSLIYDEPSTKRPDMNLVLNVVNALRRSSSNGPRRGPRGPPVRDDVAHAPPPAVSQVA
ncbi:hypothetical protein [Pendulispora albinea]|uniref:Uncharacterized protein n=1 Tax=Pendulispora albinea TaxID=2741071 RepID=A0ABZ2LZB1_9BACT